MNMTLAKHKIAVSGGCVNRMTIMASPLSYCVQGQINASQACVAYAGMLIGVMLEYEQTAIIIIGALGTVAE